MDSITTQHSGENTRLVQMGTAQGFDALLDRFPLRTTDLAAPPEGSELRPVRGDRGLPFVGLGIHTVRHGPAFQIELLRRHGPVSWWQAFGRRIVAASGPEAVQAVLTNKNKAFASGWPAVIGPWFDGGLLAMNSTEHLTDRRVLQAAYTDTALDGYLRHITTDVRAELAGWPQRRMFRAVPAIRELSGRITTMAFLGVPYAGTGRRVMRAVEECIHAETALLRLGLPGTTWRRAQRARRLLTGYLTRELSQPRSGDDFLSVLSRLDSGLSTSQLVEQMIFTLIASHDTTTAATIAAVYFLGKHPQWRERVLAEAAENGHAELNRLSTLDMVIKESIRLVSPSPIAMRIAIRDTELLGHFIPAGQLVSVCTGVNQLLPELWRDPGRFDPLRFSPGREEDRVHRMAWVPFGAGAHKCIGQQLGMLKVKATIHELIRQFEWTFPAGYEAPWRFMSLPAPGDGLPLVLAPRASKHQ